MTALPPSQQKDTHLRYFMDHLDQSVWVFDIEDQIFAVSHEWCRVRGLPLQEYYQETPEKFNTYFHPDDHEMILDLRRRQLRGEKRNMRFHYRWKHPNGEYKWFYCRANVMEVGPDGRATRIIGTDTDITEIKNNEIELSRLTGKLQVALDASKIGIWDYDPIADEIHWDDRLYEIYGIAHDKSLLTARTWDEAIHPDDKEETLAYADRCRRSKEDFSADFRIVLPDGRIRHIRSQSRYINLPGTKDRIVGVNFDVTADFERAQELEKAHAQLAYDSRHDALTGVANRRLLDETMDALVAQDPPADQVAVMHLDVDHFKEVNDTFGHAAGDAVLVHIATLVCDLVGDRGLVARVGGDEFVVLFSKSPPLKDIQDLCHQIILAVEAPYKFGTHVCNVGVSIGCAFDEGGLTSSSKIFVHADAALYRAKNAGRSCYRIYTKEKDSLGQPSPSLRHDMIAALETEAFRVAFQPQYDAETLQIVGAEALVRWQCPHRGLLQPEQFIPDAARLGLVGRIDQSVLHQVLALQDAWHAAGLDMPRVALNVSRDRLSDAGLAAELHDIVKAHHKLSFELLETAFLDKPDETITGNLACLRALNIQVELDDFGSGHASIVALQAIKPDRVKIDQRLVSPIASRPDQVVMLQSLAKIARIEGAQIVVEGLETGIHLAAIRNVDCDVLQGYALQTPLSGDEFLSLLNAPKQDAQQVRPASS